MTNGTYTNMSDIKNEEIKREYTFGRNDAILTATSKGFFVTSVCSGNTQYYDNYQAAAGRAKMIASQMAVR